MTDPRPAADAQATPRWKRGAFYLTVAGIRVCTAPFCAGLRHTERLPPEPYIIAANHRSLLDGILLVNEFNRLRKRAMHMIAYQEPFAHPFFGPILRISGCIPFDRGDPQSRQCVLTTALGFLQAGEPVGIFPEAHLSRTQRMRRGRPGVALLALESGVPVVPVGIEGSEAILPPGDSRLHLTRRATLTVGFPLDFSDRRAEFHAISTDRRKVLLDEVVQQIMLAIAALSGQTYPHTPGRRRRRAQREMQDEG